MKASPVSYAANLRANSSKLFVGPFVSGIYAGDPEKLSLRAAFPQIHQAEEQGGQHRSRNEKKPPKQDQALARNPRLQTSAQATKRCPRNC